VTCAKRGHSQKLPMEEGPQRGKISLALKGGRKRDEEGHKPRNHPDEGRVERPKLGGGRFAGVHLQSERLGEKQEERTIRALKYKEGL